MKREKDEIIETNGQFYFIVTRNLSFAAVLLFCVSPCDYIMLHYRVLSLTFYPRKKAVYKKILSSLKRKKMIFLRVNCVYGRCICCMYIV